MFVNVELSADGEELVMLALAACAQGMPLPLRVMPSIESRLVALLEAAGEDAPALAHSVASLPIYALDGREVAELAAIVCLAPFDLHRWSDAEGGLALLTFQRPQLARSVVTVHRDRITVTPHPLDLPPSDMELLVVLRRLLCDGNVRVVDPLRAKLRELADTGSSESVRSVVWRRRNLARVAFNGDIDALQSAVRSMVGPEGGSEWLDSLEPPHVRFLAAVPLRDDFRVEQGVLSGHLADDPTLIVSVGPDGDVLVERADQRRSSPSSTGSPVGQD